MLSEMLVDSYQGFVGSGGYSEGGAGEAGLMGMVVKQVGECCRLREIEVRPEYVCCGHVYRKAAR